MIRRDISRSKRIAALSPKATALFCLIIPHLNPFGKSNGDPGYIKAEMVPLIPWLTISAIRKCLEEIDKETNLRWFRGEDGTWYLHATKWDEHQALERGKRGTDRLPSHPSCQAEDKSATTRPEVAEKSTTTRRAVAPEVEIEVKEEKKGEEKVETPTPPPRRGKTPPRAFVLPDGILPETWKAFEEHRVRLRKPMTDRARTLILRELEKIGGDPNPILDQSIRRGWLDVFPVRSGPREVASAGAGDNPFPLGSKDYMDYEEAKSADLARHERRASVQ